MKRFTTVLLALAALLDVTRSASPAAAVVMQSPASAFMFVDSGAGDPAGYGQQAALTQDTATFTTWVDGTSVHVDASTPGTQVAYTASVYFEVPAGLQAGTYQVGGSYGSPRFGAGWAPGYCFPASGSFTIREIAISNSALDKLAMSFSVRCDQAAGDLRGEIRINSAVPVQGRGVTPNLGHLEDVRADRTTSVRATLTNPGDSSLDVTSVALVQSAGGQLGLRDNGCVGVTLPVGGSCGFTIDVTPTAAGAISGTLLVTDDVAPSGRAISVTVNATQGEPTFDMSNVSAGVGQTVGPVDGLVSNSGDAPMVVASGSIVGGAGAKDFSIDWRECTNGHVVPAFSSCAVKVTFTANASGDRSAIVRLQTDWGSTDSTIFGLGRPATAPPAPPAPPAPAAPPVRRGYWMVGATGDVYAFGEAKHYGNAPAKGVVDLEPSASGRGYWIVTERGAVYSFGDSRYFGGNPGLLGGERVTSLSRTSDGNGYWLFTSLGRVFPYGNAHHLGDMAGTHLNGPVLDSIPTPSGNGYYMVASDGGIFTFGDAVFAGSMGGTHLNQPVQSLVPDNDGVGYWLVASDGGIFAFDAVFYGSMGAVQLNRPVTGMVGFGSGYLMVGEDGGIFTFGETPFFGSLGSTPPAQPIVSCAVLNRI